MVPIYVRFYKQPKLHEKKLAVAEEVAVEEVTNEANNHITNSDKERYFNSIVYFNCKLDDE